MDIIHMGCKPDFEDFMQVHNGGDYMYQERGVDKPSGGLWASVPHTEHGTDWIRYLKENRFDHHSIVDGQAWRITPAQDARVCTITCQEDYEILTREFFPGYEYKDHFTGQKTPMLDWEELANLYDIIHVKDWHCMQAWDCETVVFLRWDAIGGVERATDVDAAVEEALEEINTDPFADLDDMDDDDIPDCFDPFEALGMLADAFKAREAGDEAEFNRIFDEVEKGVA